jgi:hypothetical protein
MPEISHRPAAPIDAGGADLDKSQGGMKRVRFRVRRVLVDLAENLPVSGPRRMFEQILIESARAAAPACRCRDHDPVDIDKARIARAKPLEIRAVVRSILIERQQEGVEVANPSGQKGMFEEILQPLRLQPGAVRRSIARRARQTVIPDPACEYLTARGSGVA